MTYREKIAREVEMVPDGVLPELLKFVREVRVKAAVLQSPCALLSEASLARDWLTPEEDEAWAYLEDLVDDDLDDGEGDPPTATVEQTPEPEHARSEG